MFNLLIVGSRNFDDYDYLTKKLKVQFKIGKINKILSGGAIGVDSLAEQFANEENVQFEKYIPNWSKYGKRAGIFRNQEMVNNCNFIVAIWDGISKGTNSTIKFAQQKGIDGLIINFLNDEVTNFNESLKF